jgi:predicted transcriptional regulator
MELSATGVSPDESAGTLAVPESLMLAPDDSIWSAMSGLQNFVGESIPVVDDQRLAGVLFESTLVSAYLDVLDEVRKDEHAAV